jgi:hypothetical protein
VAELLLREYLKKHDDMSQKDAANLKNFPDMVDFASKNDHINEETKHSLKELHKFRNVTYHQGKKHENFFHSIAIFYFEITCDLLAKYSTQYWKSEKISDFPLRALKYLDIKELNVTENFRTAPWNNSQFIQTSEKLRDVLVYSTSRSLVKDLAKDMEKIIEEAGFYIDHIDEVINDRDNSVKFAQYLNLDESERENFKKETLSTEIEDCDEWEWMCENYSFNEKKYPINKWKKRLRKLQSEKNEHKGLGKYCCFMRDTEKLRDDLEDAYEKCNGWLEMEAEILRGK